MPLVKVIIGSTRPNRFGSKPAAWIMQLAKEHPDTTFELVDLADINLPFLDEPAPPAFGNYANAHTHEWAKVIGEADGFIVVTAEYNFSIPAALKNAMDFLGAEWRFKPIAFVSYGFAAGGARAVEHLRSSVANLSMYDLREGVTIPNYLEHVDASGTFQPTEGQTNDAHKMLDVIGFWSTQFKAARKALEATKAN